MEKEPGFFVKDTDNLRARLIITSETVKNSRLEWARSEERRVGKECRL